MWLLYGQLPRVILMNTTSHRYSSFIELKIRFPKRIIIYQAEIVGQLVFW